MQQGAKSMEICFENKTKDTYEEIAYVSRRIQENAECVVPDINDDIGRIVSTQTEIMLKAKEQTARGLCVSGEVNASVLYITEAENKVSFVNTTKGFEIYFDSDETGDDDGELHLPCGGAVRATAGRQPLLSGDSAGIGHGNGGDGGFGSAGTVENAERMR